MNIAWPSPRHEEAFTCGPQNPFPRSVKEWRNISHHRHHHHHHYPWPLPINVILGAGSYSTPSVFKPVMKSHKSNLASSTTTQPRFVKNSLDFGHRRRPNRTSSAVPPQQVSGGGLEPRGGARHLTCDGNYSISTSRVCNSVGTPTSVVLTEQGPRFEWGSLAWTLLSPTSAYLIHFLRTSTYAAEALANF